MRVLTGLQPSGKLHIGNYFASIKPMVENQNSGDNEMFIFIANYHAMTSNSDGLSLKESTFEAACAFLALGIDPQRSIFWVQSDVKEVLELYWILSQFTPMGLLERAHSYKDKVSKGFEPYHGLFSYPVLMAADILLYDSQIVPVGKDQIQHIEIARDIAAKFNHTYGEIFTMPESKTEENIATIPGTDGAKMSKSYKNTIDIFATQKTLKKQTSKIITDSTPLEEPKEWKDCNVFNIAKLFLDQSGQEELIKRYKSGEEGYGHFKMYLKDLIWEYFKEQREKFDYYVNNKSEVDEILQEGAVKARSIAKKNMLKIRELVGIY
ncbi:tryptophanyl-tRNA synthetase [Campylobacter blaseri]|uniref:Tryptophan--tRNA ligase n=1 Tax=Campylobacter blaseri TaxID=2042961 RepID=A0A2P8R1G7_9BACT|nr:tryptophan--tRNA ligase [Campylobacter blaseri]PSM52340.1 tryptophan--tRNA ligase [Campylobacter blaseri]PSM54106.1 tryptophan--tRNA ligase [Campylobacter blaseri]QKF85549.1 tryptophanyl-tRNA synthetase [Campylobacter blaseri]